MAEKIIAGRRGWNGAAPEPHRYRSCHRDKRHYPLEHVARRASGSARTGTHVRHLRQSLLAAAAAAAAAAGRKREWETTDSDGLGKKVKGSPYSIIQRKVPEPIPVLCSQPAGDVSHKPGGRLSLLSARPAVTPATLKRAATNFAAWWTREQWVWTVCLRLLTDSVAAEIWTLATRWAGQKYGLRFSLTERFQLDGLAN